MNLKIETERLLLRPFRLEDVEHAYRMNLDPAISTYTGDGGVVSKTEIRRRIEEDVLGDYKKYGFGRLVVELKEENKFIGFSGLKYLPDLKEVDIGFRFFKEYWGKGIATESGKACVKYGFDELRLEKLIGLVLPENIASIRVLEKLGFSYEKEVLEEGLVAKKYVCFPNITSKA